MIRRFSFPKESGEVRVARTMLQLTNDSCNLEYFSSIEAFQANFEATIAHGISN
jgi:hypothetical protein